MPYQKIKTLLSTLLLCAALSTAAYAQDTSANNVDILPAKAMEERGLSVDENAHTHPPIRLTPDKSELINLESPAASIIIGNPNHLSILADSAQRLVLIPRAPGASYFTILDKNGNVIMQRHAIVASPKKEYVRVRRSCAGSGDENCQETSVFYCPDMCHEIMMNSDNENGGASGNAEANGRSSGTSEPTEEPAPEEGSQAQ